MRFVFIVVVACAFLPAAKAGLMDTVKDKLGIKSSVLDDPNRLSFACVGVEDPSEKAREALQYQQTVEMNRQIAKRKETHQLESRLSKTEREIQEYLAEQRGEEMKQDKKGKVQEQNKSQEEGWI